MSGIRQIQVKYDAYEDRALLRLSSTDGAEFRFWMTRSYARALWPQLILAGAQRQSSRTNEPPLAGGTGGAAPVDLSTPFQEGASALPLGEAPVLLATFTIETISPKEVRLSLYPRAGQGVDLRVEPALLDQLARLIARSARAAGWDLAEGTLPVVPAPRQAH